MSKLSGFWIRLGRAFNAGTATEAEFAAATAETTAAVRHLLRTLAEVDADGPPANGQAQSGRLSIGPARSGAPR